jgi:hypothetical protein
MRFLSSTLVLALLLHGGAFAQEPAAPAAPAPAAAAPRIACDEPAFNFGTADSSQTIEHTYTLKNVGDTTLEISNVRPSCGCTVANISERSVPPGGETKVTARLSLQGRMGQQHKSITVESNDPQQPQFTLTMNGLVANTIELRPDRVIFNQMGPRDVVTQSVELVAAAGTSFKIVSVTPQTPNFAATVETLQEGTHYRLNVTPQGELPVGALYGSVRVVTDNPARQLIDVPVSTMVVGELIVAPNEIVLARQPDQPVTRFIVIRPGSIPKFEVEKIDPPNKDIKVQIYPFAENGYRIQLDNIIATDALNGQFVQITTTAPGMHELKVPFKVVEPGQPM